MNAKTKRAPLTGLRARSEVDSVTVSDEAATEYVDGAPLLSVSELRAVYGTTVGVHEATISVNRGEIVGLLGANGAGKSTVLKAILGAVSVTRGGIHFEGRNITGAATEAIVRSGIGMAPEGRRIFQRLTVEENLRLGARRLATEKYRARRSAVIDRFPVLGAKNGMQAGFLSGGEQQQLAIARLLLAEPTLLLLDEPSLGLAPIITDEIFNLISALRDDGLTIIVVEQNSYRALSIADRAYVMTTGRVTLEGTAEELLHSDRLREAYLGRGA